MLYAIADCSEAGKINLFSGEYSNVEYLVNKEGKRVYIISKDSQYDGSCYTSKFDCSLFDRLINKKCATENTFKYLSETEIIDEILPDWFVNEYFRNMCYALSVLYNLDDLREESMKYDVFVSPLGDNRVCIPVSLILGIYKAYGGYYDIPKWIQCCTSAETFENNAIYLSDNMIKMFIDKLKSFGALNSLVYDVLPEY